MRPVLLQMQGFASFREPTKVDFTGADYFALVGPTGAGKSTVIDAMTFALYGSVPRWDNQRTVALALAPTAGHGAVRFVFDVAGQRYVVARELRRAAGSGAVSVRNARLERLRDPAGIGDVEEETEPIADGAAGTTEAVTELLGLPFGDFCTCVVLPQGDFAEFLHAEPRKRQEKLVRILGLGLYDTIARAANSEAAEAKLRAEVLSEQLAGYTDATAEAEQAATARVQALDGLAQRVGAAVPELAAAVAAQRATTAAAERARAEHRLLRALTVPDGLDRLVERERASAAASRAAADRVAAAEAAADTARAQLAAAPERGRLEQLRRDHAELASGQAERPGLVERAEKALADYELAAKDAADAQADLDRARSGREAAAGTLTAARELLRRLVAERAGFLGVQAPAGLAELDERRVAAGADLDRCDAALADAEAADGRARAELVAAPARPPLDHARRDLGALDEIGTRRERAVAALADARRDRAAAVNAEAAARQQWQHAQAEQAARQRDNLAAALRPTLAVGDDCPVCAQRVPELPAPLPAADLAEAERAVTAAEQAHEAARDRSAAAELAWVRAGEVLAGLDESAGRLWSAAVEAVVVVVAGWSNPGWSNAGRSKGVRPALFERLAAGLAAAGVPEAASCGVRRDAMPGAPLGTGTSGGDAPRYRASEPAEPGPCRSGGRASELTLPRDGSGVARAGAHPGPVEVSPVRPDEAPHDDADPASAESVTADPGTGLRPDPAAVAALAAAVDEVLTGLDRLADQATAADAAVRTARRDRAVAAGAASAVRDELAAATAQLRAARDPLVSFGAPDVSGDAVLSGWTTLLAWARAEAATRDQALPAARAAVSAAENTVERAEQRLRAAERAARDRRADETSAARAEQEARDAVANLDRRAEQLRVALTGAPTDREAAAELARRDELEAAAAAAETELRAARGEARSAERAAADVAREISAAWQALRAARDPLVPLNAPALPDDDLRAAWIALTGWAGERAAAGQEQLATTDTAVLAAEREVAAVAGRIAADFAAHAVPVAGPLAESAMPAAIGAVERARAGQQRLAERRAEATRIAAERDAAEAAQQVAKLLGGLLRSDGFPRWLVASALDALVADASASLIELSGGQFELTHAGGEFQVIDHADADARRPVKTLSGGETFQASLALALALSAQLSGLAAEGAPQLESIFLDEGFGTLDEANLEIVAGTLEHLAARGDRVVGVITHVPALAERVPVRFAVRRDERTSSVVRENL